MNKIFEEIKHCKYCNSKLKEIIYEIIEPDKTTELNRYFCDKCLRILQCAKLFSAFAKQNLDNFSAIITT